MAHPDQNAPADNPAPLPDDISALSYEQAMRQLTDIIDRIESGDIAVEDTLKAYERGMALRAHCAAILARTEQRVAELTPPDLARSKPAPADDR
ncbi:MAG: exodeoxyribonuclease VII small subunit [Planctomycetota bacterium]|nr:exodeoxyribonuclease VII small subunit [Planctomycetota bacterium]